MENLICPSCMKDFGVKFGMTGTNVHTCPECGACYVVMYADGFTDGVRTSKVEPAKQSAPPNNKRSTKSLCENCMQGKYHGCVVNHKCNFISKCGDFVRA